MSDREKEKEIETEAETADTGREEKAPEAEEREKAAPEQEAEAEAAEGEGSPEEEAKPESKGKAKLFGKKKPDRRDEKIKELEDKTLRQMAEFENFRKRTEKEKSQMYDMGVRSVVEKILPVIDNFERGLSTLSEEQKKEPFAEGIDKVYTQLMTELTGMGVTPIEALGCEFDPELHNAVMQTETDEYEPGQVAQELQKGYKYRDTVVRHSMVAVAK